METLKLMFANELKEGMIIKDLRKGPATTFKVEKIDGDTLHFKYICGPKYYNENKKTGLYEFITSSPVPWYQC
jgi:hypothetical protein